MKMVKTNNIYYLKCNECDRVKRHNLSFFRAFNKVYKDSLLMFIQDIHEAIEHDIFKNHDKSNQYRQHI